MAEIADIVGVTGGAALDVLQERLRAVATEYRRVISVTPCDMPGAPSDETLSQRLAWVDAQLLNPIGKLLEALDPENRHMLSLWPEEVSPELVPDRSEERRVGKECVRTCRSRGAPNHK